MSWVDEGEKKIKKKGKNKIKIEKLKLRNVMSIIFLQHFHIKFWVKGCYWLLQVGKKVIFTVDWVELMRVKKDKEKREK